MPKIYFLWMCFMLISNQPEVNCCLQAQFLYKDNCCNMCPAGTQLSKYCGATNQTTCERCLDDTFTEQVHSLKTCYHCLDCKREGFVVYEKCQFNKNTVCGCRVGYFCSKKGFYTCWNCKRHTPCPAGEGIKVPGTNTADNICGKCPPGTYSDSTTVNKCKPITDCHSLGMISTLGGSSTKNKKCIYPEVIVLPLAVFAILCVAVVIFWNNNWVRCRRTGRSGNAEKAEDETENPEKSLDSKKGNQPSSEDQIQTVRKLSSSSFTLEEAKSDVISEPKDTPLPPKLGESKKADSLQIIQE
ncbi:tumor necrosis factor receptor superfamily member 14-like isoform X1 [Scyliorhinus canicula]|uniref:tumor necrosis factor receptor superfamily member 14-like isoform X1 n=1 Tax=Scyliorhinus canicula TaxID=7830 RepID=UPI0018F7208A|nr:tumor necrosis factor receptor superfamily member 14-like isoform X1 [Scyliorhinus canicula]